MIPIYSSKKRPAILVAGLFILSILFLQCEPQEKSAEKQLRPDTEGGTQTVVNNINYEELMIRLMVMQERIKEAPEVVSLRQNIVALSLDSTSNAIYTMGTGLFPENAANTAVARQSAERAAFIDACRWAAYVLAWKDNPEAAPFGTIQGNLPNAATVHKTLSPDGAQAYALVKVEL